eukprot:6434393-Pyramimonas_sp.AAC.1
MRLPGSFPEGVSEVLSRRCRRASPSLFTPFWRPAIRVLDCANGPGPPPSRANPRAAGRSAWPHSPCSE